jgi:TolB-like protein/DNA-binding winged helix-turn-helix (wHTH) protein/tetratricopeptide (TPR) repeat protein
VNDSLQSGFGIGDWEVYPQENLLKGPNRECVLEPKVMDVLVLLAGRPGDVVSRQQLLDFVWADVVVGDEVVSRAISVLRTELGDDQKDSRYLKTISKRGYRLIADVIPLASDGPQQVASASDASASATPEHPSESITHFALRKLDFIIITVLVLALGYFAYDKFLLQPESGEVFGDIGRSIAVLPFVNMSGDSGDEYFSDGLSEEILNLLVKIPELRVAARTSSFSYKGKDVKIAQIGEELDVTHVLEGSVRRAGNRVRITAKLVKADDGFHLWSETFDRTLDDIFVIQDEIASAVVDALKVKLLDAMPTTEVTDPEVYALYLQGRYFDNLKGKENWEKAVSAFRQTLAIDPEYAPAWVAISGTYTYQTRAKLLSREKGSALALEAVERALAIDNNMASAWASLAYWKRYYEWDWEGATAALDKALQLEPNNARALSVAASLAGNLGQTSAATVLHEQALARDPLNLTSLSALGQDYMRNGRLDEAIETFSRLVALNPEYLTGHSNLGRAYFLKGDVKRALIEIDKSPSGRWNTFEKIQIHFTLGNHAEAQTFVNEYLEKYSREDPVRTAALYASLGDNDTAFEWLETAFQQRDGGLSWILVNVHLKNLESDPRYPVFLEKLGLLAAWKAMSPEYGGPSEIPTASGR